MAKLYSLVITILLVAALAFSGYSYYILKIESQDQIAASKTQIALLSQQLNDSQKAQADSAAKLPDLQNKIAAIQAQAQQQAAETEQQKNVIPVQIVETLNDMLSSIQTGISRDDYGKKLITIKTAISTYGGSLPADKTNSLGEIVSYYGYALFFWSKVTGDYPDTIFIGGMGGNYQEEKALLDKFGIKNPDSPTVYDKKMVLNKFWDMAAQDTNQLLHAQVN